MAYSIFRGPTRRQPETVNLPVAGAYLPGMAVVASATALTAAVAIDAESEFMILSNVEFSNQTVTTAYTSGDTGIAYVPLMGDTYMVQMAAGTYALGDALTIDANGRFAAAGTGARICAYCDQAGTFTAGQLADARIANRVTNT